MRITAWILAVLLVSSSVCAEELPIVGDFNAKPKNWLDEAGQAKGIHIDLLEEIGLRTGITFTYSLSPWKRAFVESEQGKAAIIGFSKTSEREQNWFYSDPLYFDELVFVTTKEKNFDFTGLRSIDGRRVGVKLGATYGDDFEKAKEEGHVKIVETTDRVGQLRMLVDGRVDLVLLSPGKIALETVISENEWLTAHRDEFSDCVAALQAGPELHWHPKSHGQRTPYSQDQRSHFKYEG